LKGGSRWEKSKKVRERTGSIFRDVGGERIDPAKRHGRSPEYIKLMENGKVLAARGDGSLKLPLWTASCSRRLLNPIGTGVLGWEPSWRVRKEERLGIGPSRA